MTTSSDPFENFASPVVLVTTLVVALFGIVYWFLTRNHGIFEAQGLFSIKPNLLFGNTKDLLFKKVGILDFHLDLYKKFEGHKYGIFYEGLEACFYVRDPDMIKQVLIRDFDHFTDIAFFLPECIRHMDFNDIGLPNATGERWKAIRTAMLPAFNLKNMKEITSTACAIAGTLADSLRSKKDVAVEVESLTSPYALDCMTQLGLGLDIGAVARPDNEFARKAEVLMVSWRLMLASYAPWVMRILRISLFNNDSMSYFIAVARKIIAERDSSRTDETERKTDILGIMMRSRDPVHMTDNTICKNVINFYLDGYDTVTSTLTLCLYYLAVNPEVQERAIEEVDEVAERKKEGGGHLRGEDAKELIYLEQVFHETMRIGGLPFTQRLCTKAWKIPETEVVIPKGTRVYVAMAGMHLDPNYYPDPTVFDPERFSGENKGKIPGGAFIPFGMGPRQCIGMQIVKLEAKLMMYQILRRFRVEPCERTVVPVVWRKDHFNRIEGGCWLKFVERS